LQICVFDCGCPFDCFISSHHDNRYYPNCNHLFDEGIRYSFCVVTRQFNFFSSDI
jgi:hypothetical protein